MVVDINEKYKVDIDKLQSMEISILKTVHKTGVKHLKYYNSTMSAFKNPEKRMKCQDTKYYEEVLPIIDKILEHHGKKQRT